MDNWRGESSERIALPVEQSEGVQLFLHPPLLCTSVQQNIVRRKLRIKPPRSVYSAVNRWAKNDLFSDSFIIYFVIMSLLIFKYQLLDDKIENL